jgi:hypothetical protein
MNLAGICENHLLNLSRLLHPRHYRRRWLAMIQAYIDEGGTHDQAKVIAMSGFLSSYKRWGKFEKEWNDTLNPPEEPRPQKPLVFHATDCLGAEGYKDFKDWSKARRSKLVDKLVPIVKKRTLFSFSCAFSLQEYEEVVPEWIKKQMKHPYYVCMFTIANVLKINRPKFSFSNEKIAFVFAHKPKFVGLLSDLYDNLKQSEALSDILGKMTIGCPEEDIPLQAADLLCYVARTFHEKDYFKRGSAQLRTIELARNLGLGSGYLHPDFLPRIGLEGFVQSYTEAHELVGDWDWKTNRGKRRRGSTR